jgi:long-chain acyl-CoA synthetase
MNFLDNIFTRLESAREHVVLQETHATRPVMATGGGLLGMVAAAREFLRGAGLRKGDRCVLLANNGIRWVALDLALMAEGIIVVPLYARQAPGELAAMMKDSQAALICCGDESLRDAIAQVWAEAPRCALFDEIFGQAPATNVQEPPLSPSPSDAVTIIYTSGTSGEAKGVVLNQSNLSHMLRCTTERLNGLMGSQNQPERIFHYLPLCFAGSWIMLLSGLTRSSVITLSMDLNRLAEDIPSAAPHYFLNVPTLLERVRSGIETNLKERGGMALAIFRNAREAWAHKLAGRVDWADRLWLRLANSIVFPAIRKRLGSNLRALICGSAPLSVETQEFFIFLGIPVLQVYGLTETTAICTMDLPQHIEPGWAGYAIEGLEMQLGENHEILVRGPNIFSGYWNRPQETERVFEDGWFHTGDQGEFNLEGNWRIIGRIKNLIILNSGHNIAPEPIEEKLLQRIPGVRQAMLTGNGRSFLTAIIVGETSRMDVQDVLDAINIEQPHYKQIRGFHITAEPFTIENGLLTVNGKLKRDAIFNRYQNEIEALYAVGRAAAR